MRRILLLSIVILLPLQSSSAQDTTIVRRTAGGFMVDFQYQDMRLVISALADAGGLNVSYTNLPNMRTTLRMSQPISQAEIADVLRSIVESNGLRMVQEGSMFRIERATPQTATQLRTQQAVQEPLLPFIYRLRHANAVQLATTLNQVFGQIGGRATVQTQPIQIQQGRGAGPGRGGGAGGAGNLQPNQ